MSQVAIIDIEGANPQIPTRFDANSGFAIPIANTLEIFGAVVNNLGIPVRTVASGNTVTTNVQIAATTLVSNRASVGLVAPNANDFTIDADGFLSLVGGGGAAITEFGVDSTSGTGVNPVVPNASGRVTITATQVPASGFFNTINVNSSAPNQYEMQIQRSSSALVGASQLNGTSHYDSSSFAVSPAGFVTAAATGIGKTITGNSGGPRPPAANNWNLVTANASVQFVGAASTLTQDFGLSNLALGSALPAFVTASDNVGLGRGVFNTLTTGTFNTFVGHNTGGATGVTQGSGNNGFGLNTLVALTTGNRNIAMGYNAGATITTGTDNVLIGYLAGNSLAASDSSNVNIANSGTSGDSHIIRIGTQGSGNNQHTDIYLAGVLHTTSGRTRNITVPGAYPYTVLSTDDIISVSTAGGARTINLPNAPTAGTTYVIKDVSGNAAANNITVTTPGGVVTIDNATTYVMNTNFGSGTFYSNATSYFVI